MDVCLRVCASHSCLPSALRGQKRVFDPLGLDLQTVVSQKCVLGIEPRSSTLFTHFFIQCLIFAACPTTLAKV